MDKNTTPRGGSTDYVPLLCRFLKEIISEPAAHTRIANMLLVACHRELNGGCFPNALDEWEDNRQRILRCFDADDWDTIKSVKSAYWHFEGRDLVADIYSAPHEQSMLAKKRGGRKGALHRWRRGRENAGVDGMPCSLPHAINKEITLPSGSSISNGLSPLGAGEAVVGEDNHPGDDTPASQEEITRMFTEYAHGNNHAE